MKKELKELVLNKELIIDENQKKIITSAEGGRYTYFDFTKEKISEIALKSFIDLSVEDACCLVQALFPGYLVCSGLIYTFLIYEIKAGKRVSPPICYFRTLDSYLNNNNEFKFNYLAKEIVDLFEKNNISYREYWKRIAKEI